MRDHSEYVLEPIRQDAEFTLYRGRQRGDQTPVLAVAPAAKQPLPHSLRRLEHEYSLASELEPEWAAKPLALTRHEGRTILVLADPGGEPLDRVLERDKELPPDPARFLRIAIGLASALGRAHRRGLIHKDVKPENVLVDDAGRVGLTGFGIASRLPRERQAPAPPEIIAGTLAYMSPEQTGRMNRSMDTRSDLYSLGVTLYQMLTGVLPFAAADPLEWVHCHIARQPVTPADRAEIPRQLSEIVMKLLAKNAEERFQTAAGLEADLRRCLAEWQSHGCIDPFPLGTDDSSDRLLIPEKLYGREREVDTLLAAFDRVVTQGAAELVLVSGYSGVGKSSVVNELHKVLVPPRGLFAAGKFDQYKRDVPYATLAQAFQMLVRQILVASEAEVEHWRHSLLEALGPNGQLIIDLIPEVEFVIGKQPPVTELPPQEARARFQLVFRRFLGAFARREHPLALFLDDLQWLDTATLELLERLVTDADVRHVLLIGAYRDNEVSSSHPLMRTLAAIRDAGARVQEMVLAALGLDDVERLIADALHCGPDSAGPLVLLVYEKTDGNPFFAIQLLTALAEEGLLQFDRGAAAWTWDLDRIRGKGYSDNVVDLMLGKLRRLPQHTQTALQQLASLGNIVEIARLNMVFGQSEEGIHKALLEAGRFGLVLRLEGSYAFLHDRVQESAYFLIPEAQRARTHLRIGRILAESTPSERLEEAIFDIVNQLNRGSHLIADAGERERAADLNLIAGKRAKASNDHHQQLEIWALHCPANFETKTALASAEIARIECRMLDAEHLYEVAIRSAHDNGFAHCEAVSNECAARFYLARGFTRIAHVYWRESRDCYLRWGAEGKARQLEELHPQIQVEKTSTDARNILASVEQLDLATVVRVSEALSAEIALEKLIDTLMRTAIEHAGAERGLLILFRGGEPRMEAEATTGQGGVEVAVRQAAVTPADLPQSVMHYVLRTQEGVLLDDASADNVYAKDEYVRRKRSKSVLCLPILKQKKLVGALYLENNLTPCAFTPDRVTVLQLLASQAAISLENATLYSELQLQAGLLHRLPVSAWTLRPDGTPDFVNQVWLEFSGQTLDFVRSRPEAWMTAVHPEDREAALRAFWVGVRSGQGFAIETRSLRAQDGTYRWHLQQAVVLRDAEGKVLKFVGTTTDIDNQKRAEEKIRQSEKEARQLLDLSPLHITELGPDGARLYTNRASLDYYGTTLEEWQDAELQQVLHPQDAETVTESFPEKLQSGSPFEYEVRLKRKDGQYRWFHYRLSPMSDEQGRITRWYAAGTDIEELKFAEQRLQQQNVALREEIDKASMFEEIVGGSAPLKKVLSRISKVAPTDSSVLITGETGTGKELVARAIHRRSRRFSNAFVSVNCAAIPRDLIASELFGHEKGAFTGATNLRLGRFELAAGGTIFLDEVGELPAETQIALLRVLQEREFQRVGGASALRTDVRVIAATNRDLEAAIAAGKFRSDLFYRLNVFPIEIPSLRERKEDIPLLVEYFLDRYGRKSGKSFRTADKRSLDALQSYPWPGNIRELQNVIERSVIVGDGDTFSVDESWLSRRAPEPANALELPQQLTAQEKEMIVAALRECKGRVSGASGAAARLGMPGSTLESKIRSLKIDKKRFKA